MGYIDNLPISHVLYEFYKEDRTVVLLEHHSTIYMGDNMIHYFSDPIKCEDNDLRINLHPKLYDPNNNNAQSITLPVGTSIPVEYNGVISCISFRIPTKYDVKNCM